MTSITALSKGLLLGIVTAGVGFAGVIDTLYAQEQTRQPPDVKFSITLPGSSQPVKLVQILINDKPIPQNVPVPVVRGWLSHVTVVMQNISNKDIVSGEVILELPDTGTGRPSDNKPIMSVIARLGREPATAFRRRDGTSRPVPPGMLQMQELRISPGETARFEFRTADETEDEAYRTIPDIRNVIVLPRTFYFADGSRWSGGTYLIPVPPPELWKAVPPGDF